MRLKRDKQTYPTFPFWDHCAIRLAGIDWPIDVCSPEHMAETYKWMDPDRPLRAMSIAISQNPEGTEVTVYPPPGMDYEVVRA